MYGVTSRCTFCLCVHERTRDSASYFFSTLPSLDWLDLTLSATVSGKVNASSRQGQGDETTRERLMEAYDVITLSASDLRGKRNIVGERTYDV